MTQFQPSAYEIALLIAGFVLGIFFLISILKLLGFGNHRNRRRSGRRNHHRRRYYDDDEDEYDDEDEERRGGWFIPILILIILSVAGVSRLQKAGVFLTSKSEAIPKTEGPKHNSVDITLPPLQDTEPGLNRDIYMPKEGWTADTEAPDQTSAGLAHEYYIRVCVLSNPENVDPTCQKLLGRGFSVHTMDKESGTAIYVGPYPTKEQAEQINAINKFAGILEVY